MRLILSGRRSGRTSELIRRCHEAEARGFVSYIVCHRSEEAYRISEQARQAKLDVRFPITYDEFLQKQYAGKNIGSFFIDNTEMLLERLTPVYIDTAVILGVHE